MSGSKKYPEPTFYFFMEIGNTTIYHSRKIHYNYNGIRFNTAKRVNNKYQNESIDTINRNVQFLVYEDWEEEKKFEQRKNIDYEHSNN